MTYRVVQWTTGNVGKSSVRAIASNPTLELVGCYAWSPEKAGHDVGDLCGIEALNVKATNDIDALLALKPNCVVYNPMFANVDELVRILGAGINVVGTAGFITGHFLGEGRDRIAEACKQGESTIFGSGINPGFIQLFAIVSAGLSDRVDKVSMLESVDTTIYNSPATERPMGFGHPVDQPDLPAITSRLLPASPPTTTCRCHSRAESSAPIDRWTSMSQETTNETSSPQLHHVVFAVAPERHATAAQMFSDLGFAFESLQLTELGLDIHLDWNRGIELISPIPGSSGPVAASVNQLLELHGDGVYTVVIRVPAASAAESVAERYGGTTRFRQNFKGEGSYLDEIDLSVLGLPLTFLVTNIP